MHFLCAFFSPYNVIHFRSKIQFPRLEIFFFGDQLCAPNSPSYFHERQIPWKNRLMCPWRVSKNIHKVLKRHGKVCLERDIEGAQMMMKLKGIGRDRLLLFFFFNNELVELKRQGLWKRNVHIKFNFAKLLLSYILLHFKHFFHCSNTMIQVNSEWKCINYDPQYNNM
mgnify:CR=1 FL=1